MQTLNPEPFLSGFKFTECPRWHDDRLWFSDMRAGMVYAAAPDGTLEKVVAVPGDPGGIGFAVDGSLLVVSMKERRLLRYSDGDLTQVADMSVLELFSNNDMVVDREGRAYIGGFGFDLGKRETPRTTNLIMVSPEGAVSVAAPDLSFPNGIVITPDGRTLIVAESMARRLTAFAVAPNGTLSGRRTFAEFPHAVPDGICLDAEGAVWVASPSTRDFLRVLDGGEITHRVPLTDRRAYACMLGDDDRRTLYLCTAETNPQDPASATAHSWIESVRVDVPGAGLP